jgi:hypothetical protein
MASLDLPASGRPLATIQVVCNVADHPSIAALRVGRVSGWNVVFPRSLGLENDDRVIFCEDGARLPIAPIFKGFPVTVKATTIQGARSDGLVIPLRLFASDEHMCNASVGDDVTEHLGIVKFCRDDAERKESLVTTVSTFGKSLAWCPSKTHENRGQTYERIYFDAMQGLPYYITLKYNGESITKGPRADGQGVSISSRNNEIPSDTDDKDGKRFLQIGRTMPDGLVIQAEAIGPGIHGNEHQLDEKDYRIFNAFTIDGTPLPYAQLTALDKFVQILEEGDSFHYTCAKDLEHVLATLLPDGKRRIEGIVVRPQVPRRVGGNSSIRGKPLSFKILNERDVK